MLRLASLTLRRTGAICFQAVQQTSSSRTAILSNQSIRNFTAFSPRPIQPVTKVLSNTKNSLPSLTLQIDQPIQLQVRTVTKFSIRSGKRKSVKAALKRFFRLHWGGWIRTRCGRHKKMYKKSANRKHRLRQHVFVNATQSTLLDKMATKFWLRPKHYVDDIYEPYHTRTFFHARRTPMPAPSQPFTRPLTAWQLSKRVE